MKNAIEVITGSDNIFADIGVPNAAEHLAKAHIVAIIDTSIRARKYTQAAAAKRMGIAQPDVSKLLRGGYDGFSLERLIGFLLALGHDLDLEVRPANDTLERGRLRLSAAL